MAVLVYELNELMTLLLLKGNYALYENNMLIGSWLVARRFLCFLVFVRILGFLASRFRSCMVSWFLVYWFQSFKDSPTVSISCFLIDIGLVSKICKIVFDGSPGFLGAHLFQKCKKCGVCNTWRFTRIICFKASVIFLNFV